MPPPSTNKIISDAEKTDTGSAIKFKVSRVLETTDS